MNQAVMPYAKEMLQLAEGEEMVIFIHGKAFVITPATDDDIERITKGYFVMD